MAIEKLLQWANEILSDCNYSQEYNVPLSLDRYKALAKGLKLATLETTSFDIDVNLAQRQQDFDMAERRARFALECAKSAGPWAYTERGDLLPSLESAINDFLVAKGYP